MAPGRGLFALIALGAVALAGCASGPGPGGTPNGTASSSPAAGSAKAARDLVLTARELPEGLSMADFPMDDDVVRAVLDPLTGSRPEGTTYSPPTCAPVSMFGGSAQPGPALTGVIAGQGAGRSTFTEAVVVQRPDIAAVADHVRSCPSVRQSDGSIALTTASAVRDAAQTRADELLVVEETPDDPLSQQRALLAYARVGGYAVWVRLRAFQGEPVDRAQFDRLVAAAVDKVARTA